MTDAQRDELERLRMKAASMGFVTVPRALLACVLLEAKVNSKGFANVTAEVSRISAKGSRLRVRVREMEAAELARIAELRAIAGIE
jgi:hypothetical protein